MGSSAVDRSREVGQRSREGPARAYWTPCSPALRLATRQLRLPADQPGRRHRPLPAPKAQQDHRETRPVLASLIKVCWSRRPSAEIPRSRSASRIASSVQRTSAPPGAAEARLFDRRAEGAKVGASAPRRKRSGARAGRRFSFRFAVPLCVGREGTARSFERVRSWSRSITVPLRLVRGSACRRQARERSCPVAAACHDRLDGEPARWGARRRGQERG